MHAKNLRIVKSSIYFMVTDKEYPKIELDQNYVVDEKRDFITIPLSRDCVRDANYTLHMAFYGDIQDSLKGFYRGVYINLKGEQK